MKKILINIIFIILPVITFAQLSGDGSYSTPYSGTFQGDLQWNSTNFPGGKVYINGDVTIDNEQLTIETGMSIIFVSEGADLIITGTGQLEASGSSGNEITFTADDDNDGNYGETGESWGHIFFNSPSETNQSIIDFCIIEYGDVHLFSDYQGYGGAIHSNFSNLIISNTTLRYNYGEWGGAIFVSSSENPTISNCNIFSNKSDRGGGGIYCWNSSSSIIENCLFDGNQCLEPSVAYYTGGGLAAQSNCSIKVLNCTFVNNSSTRSEGQGIMLYGSPNSMVINSIFWGAAEKQIYCYATNANTIINCAYRGLTTTAGLPVNPIVLNASNSASDGPNFNNPAGFDWSILFISPCRDAGTTPSPTVPDDYIGNSRIGPYDIGAYEVQYSRWLTNASSPTSWTNPGNWEQGIYPGITGGTGDVVIPNLADYTYAPNISGTTTISSGKSMILEPGAKATFATLTNNGTLKLKSDAAGIFSLIVTSYSGNDPSIDLFLTGGGTKTPLTYKWHYISPPVASLAVSTFAPTYTLDVAQWIENRPITSLTQAWVAYDGWIYASQSLGGPTFSTLTAGKGYDFFDSTDNTFTFGGTLNTTDVNVNLNYTSGDDFLYGYNLIGNPFSSGLDWDYIITHSFPVNTTKSLYFTRNSVLCSYIAGVGVPGDVTGIIPPMQGFFSKTSSTGNTIVLAAAARTHNNIHPTYKGKQVIPLVRLALSDSSMSDETVVRFDDLAKSYLDNDYDAVKLFLDPDLPSVYSSLSGTDYTINGLPFPESFIEIPITINIATDSTPKIITASQLQGLDNYDVTLTDNSTGFTADLRTTPSVTFAAPKGTTGGRFVLKISSLTTGTENPTISSNRFNIYQAGSFINIQTISDEWEGKSGSVRVLDLSGKTMTDLQNNEFTKNSLLQIQSPLAKGLYLVEIKAGAMRYVGKIVIR